MGDEYDAAEADYWAHVDDYAVGHYEEDEDLPQDRSFINPRGLSKRQLREEEAHQREMLMPSISINRGGIQFPMQTTSPTVSGALNMVKTFETNYPSFHEWAIAKENPVRATEDILAEAEAMRAEADRLERMASEREKYGADPFKNGTVLKVDMKYRTTNRSYAYAVIKVAGKFYLSGRMGSNMTVDQRTGGMAWDNFVAWLAQGDATVWQAGSLKQVL